MIKLLKTTLFMSFSFIASGCSNEEINFEPIDEVVNPSGYEGCITRDVNHKDFDVMRGLGLTDDQILNSCSIFQHRISYTDQDTGKKVNKVCMSFTTAEDDLYYYHTTSAHCFMPNFDRVSIGHVEIYDQGRDRLMTYEQYEVQGSTSPDSEAFIRHTMYGPGSYNIEIDQTDTLKGSSGAIVSLRDSLIGVDDPDTSYDIALFKTRKVDHLWKPVPFNTVDRLDIAFKDHESVDYTTQPVATNSESYYANTILMSLSLMKPVIWRYDVISFVNTEKITNDPDGWLGDTKFIGDIKYGWVYDGVSGSPYFDENNNVIGVISGAACFRCDEFEKASSTSTSFTTLDLYKAWQLGLEQGGDA